MTIMDIRPRASFSNVEARSTHGRVQVRDRILSRVAHPAILPVISLAYRCKAWIPDDDVESVADARRSGNSTNQWNGLMGCSAMTSSVVPDASRSLAMEQAQSASPRASASCASTATA